MLKFFDKDLDTVEMKFLGLGLIVLAIVVLSVLELKEVVMALIAILGGIVRDLYRSSTNEEARQIHQPKEEAK